MLRGRHRKNVNDCYFMDSFACGFKTRSRVADKSSKTVHVCYSMGLSACGCETRAAPSNSLATTALFTSWNHANALNVFSALSATLNEIMKTLSTLCLCLPRSFLSHTPDQPQRHLRRHYIPVSGIHTRNTISY